MTKEAMKTDTQHLDYLISQYVDGCLDPSSKKSLEQKLVNDPVARQSYKEQRDVQDVLDDWGNRIPMIDWNDFDKKLAGRLENEVVGGGKVPMFKRWARPMAAAAALFVAATVGYSWHAFSTGSQVVIVPHGESVPHAVGSPVIIERIGTATPKYSRQSFSVDDAPSQDTIAKGTMTLEFSPPEDVAAATSLNEALNYGLQRPGLGSPQSQVPSAAGGTAMHFPGDNKEKNEKEAGPDFRE